MVSPVINNLRLLVVGPASPPAGGMAAQTHQICTLLSAEGVEVLFLQTNRPIGIALFETIPVIRAGVRLIKYVIDSWRSLARVDLVHVMSNSGWSWQLYSAPVLWLARCRGVPVIVNYRGGGAEPYFRKSERWIRPSLDKAAAIVVPSGFLSDVFFRYGYSAHVISNIVDVDVFSDNKQRRDLLLGNQPKSLILVRNLETIYGVDVAIHAFSRVLEKFPHITLKIAGSGPEESNLKALSKKLLVEDNVIFLGRLSRKKIVDLYQSADIFLNSSRVDNMPNSLLEAMSSGVPIISTRAGGIPRMVCSEDTALLVDIDDVDELASQIARLLSDQKLRRRLIDRGIEEAKRYSWTAVKSDWLSLYSRLAGYRRQQATTSHREGLRPYTRLVSHFLFPLQEKLKGHRTLELRRSLEMSQWLTSDQLRREQTKKLRTFLSQLKVNVSYFEGLFQKLSFDPDSIDDISDLAQLPMMSKAIIRDNTDALRSNTAIELKRFSTGGSSGNPLVFYLDNERISHDVAAKWRATRWWNVDIGDPEMVVWGSPIELGAQDRVRNLRDKIYRTQLFSAFDLSDTTLTKACDQLRRQRPEMVFGYPSVISSIAKFANENAIDLIGLDIAVVFVTAERLYPEQRSIIETAFGCKVANGYGGRDSGFIAHECPHGSLHISAEDIIVEIVDDEGQCCSNGEQGNIVVTHMATSGFPFVRYQTGDVGVLSDQPCSCGRGLPVLQDIVGRSSDFVVAEDGSKLHGAALTYVLREVRGVESFKIIQKTQTLLHVKIVKGKEYQATNEVIIAEEFSKRLGNNLQCVFDYPQKIDPEISGKYRYIVCEVAS